MKETIGDIDILVSAKAPQAVIKAFIELPMVTKVLSRGGTKSSVIMEEKLQVDLRVVEPESFGAALQYFTGSKAHNIKLRELANTQGYKINEYGLFRIKDNKKVAGKEEEEIYRSLGLEYLPPEIREDSGEIEAGKDKRLPRLLEEKDIKGDLHMHSHWSDGHDSIEDMAKAARELGYEYIGLTDHSRSLKVARGLSLSEAKEQLAEIKALNQRLKGIRVLAGCEVDILGNGEIDYPEGLLSLYDFVVAAIHTGFKQPKEVLTERIIKAMHHPGVNIIAHPTGRLLGKREPYSLDLEAIFREAKSTGTYLELNTYPERLDLSDIYLRHMKELGLKVVLGSDAHSIIQLKLMTYGVAMARRGWLEKSDVLNTLKAEELLRCFEKRPVGV
jgi:DNA polymerase (family 10)